MKIGRDHCYCYCSPNQSGRIESDSCCCCWCYWPFEVVLSVLLLLVGLVCSVLVVGGEGVGLVLTWWWCEDPLTPPASSTAPIPVLTNPPTGQHHHQHWQAGPGLTLWKQYLATCQTCWRCQQFIVQVRCVFWECYFLNLPEGKLLKWLLIFKDNHF